MIKKLVVISDIHVRTFKRHDEYIEQFDKFYALAEAEKPDRIVITGDVVHQKIQMSPELINVVSEFLNRCAQIAKTIVLIGNHDFLTNNKERLDALTPIVTTMHNPNIVYFKNSGCFEDDDVIWVPISLMDDNKVPEDFNPKKKVKGKTYIGLFHSPLAGTETELGHVFDNAYSLDNFFGLDIVLAGDIHKHQLIQAADPLIIMTGSFLQQNYGETISKHGYVTVDVTERSYELHEILNDYGYYQFKLNSVDDIETGGEVLLNG
jgi:exonuclease SbcD